MFPRKQILPLLFLFLQRLEKKNIRRIIITRKLNFPIFAIFFSRPFRRTPLARSSLFLRWPLPVKLKVTREKDLVGSVEPVIGFPFFSSFFCSPLPFLLPFISPPLLHPYSRFHGFHGYFQSTSLFSTGERTPPGPISLVSSENDVLIARRNLPAESLQYSPAPSIHVPFHDIFLLPLAQVRRILQSTCSSAARLSSSSSSYCVPIAVCVHSRSRVSKKEKKRKENEEEKRKL